MLQNRVSPLQKWAGKQILDTSRSTGIEPEDRVRNKQSARTVFLTDVAVTARSKPGWMWKRGEGAGHHFSREEIAAENKMC